MSRNFRYSPWDGTQVPFELDALDAMDGLADDLLTHGDVNAALRRAMRDGMRDRNGDRIQGLREMLEKVREARQQRLDDFDLGGVFAEIARELEEVLDDERGALDRAEQATADPTEGSSDPAGDGESGEAGERGRRDELTAASVAERRAHLDLLPPDLAGRMRSLESYRFESAAAEERFEQLVERLRQELLSQVVDNMSDAMANMTPEDLARMKDMMAELNAMLEARERGEEPDFAGFMERYGDFFPENPETLDELLEAMAQRMAAMSALMASMSPEQRAQLQALSDQLLEDMDLRWQMDQLGQNLQNAFPNLDWGRSYEFEGSDPLDWGSARDVMSELADLDGLEDMLSSMTQPAGLAEVDMDVVRRLVGPDEARSLERLAELTDMLRREGLVDQNGDRLELTAAGIRRLGQSALRELFQGLDPSLLGGHDRHASGLGHERTGDSSPWEWGDPFSIDIRRTLHSAVRRHASEGRPPGGRVTLDPSDFEVEETEQSVRSATVLLLDLSYSMPMRGNFLPAKKVTLALHSLISMQYPRDYLGVVGFSQVARELAPTDLPSVEWDFVYGTNMQHAFVLARRMLASQPGSRQIVMITDGEPTAHIDVDGEPLFHYPPLRETVEATLREVLACTRSGITINTFMLDADAGLKNFVERMTELNRGRAFYTTPETLGDFVLVDFIEHKRAMLRGRAS